MLDADEFSAAVSAVTSAFGDPTRRDIYLAIRETPAGVTATEVAERFASAPQRRAPSPREAVGRRVRRPWTSTASPALVPPGARRSATGSPSRTTVLTFPPRRDDLLATLLARALDVLPPDQAEAMAEEVGLRLRQDARRAHGPERGPPFGQGGAGHRRRSAHRARLRRARRVQWRRDDDRLGPLPVRSGRAGCTRTSCARSTAA